MASAQRNVTMSDMFSKLVSYQQGRSGGGGGNAAAGETTPLTGDPATDLATAGKQMVNETVEKIKKLNESAPYSFRVLGLLGGFAMIISNALCVVGRFLTLNFTGAIIAFYCVIFGVIIVLLEADTLACPGSMNGRSMEETVRFYFKFLEYTWGRGLLYFFVGTLQFSNWNMMDCIVGGFMMFVGATATMAGVKTAQDLRRLRLRIKDERDLRKRWDKYDKDKSGYLGIDELTEFIKDAGIDMTKNQVVSAYLALNKKFDDKLSYDELVEWWSRPQAGLLSGMDRVSV